MAESAAPIELLSASIEPGKPPRATIRTSFRLHNTDNAPLWLIMPASVESRLKLSIEAASFESFSFESNPEVTYLNCYELYAEGSFSAFWLDAGAEIEFQGFAFRGTATVRDHELWVLPEIALPDGSSLDALAEVNLLNRGCQVVACADQRRLLGKVTRAVTLRLEPRQRWSIALDGSGITALCD